MFKQFLTAMELLKNYLVPYDLPLTALFTPAVVKQHLPQGVGRERYSIPFKIHFPTCKATKMPISTPLTCCFCNKSWPTLWVGASE